MEKRAPRRRIAALSGLMLTLVAGLLGFTATPAQAVSYITTFTFDKNPSNPKDSRLIWKVYHVEGDEIIHVEQSVYRAGSGDGSTNQCEVDHGWLPNGYYDVTLHEYYNGNEIKGIVFRLNDTPLPCRRTQLFIHSEMTRDHGQYCPTTRDDPQCWDTDDDYKSRGCIKLSPGDVDHLRWQWRRFYSVGQLVPQKLSVIS